MASSKDITAYNPEEIEIMLLALTTDLTLPFGTEKEAKNVRSRLYAVRTAAIHSWKTKEKLKASGLSTTHLDNPIVDAAQEIMSLTIMMEGTTLTLGRRLLKASIKSVLTDVLKAHGREGGETKAERTVEEAGAAMLKQFKENEGQSSPEEKNDDIYGNLGYTTKPHDTGEDS